MTSKQYHTQKMGHAVSTSLETITATNAVPALLAGHDELKTCLTDIKTLARLQETPLTGQTVDRAKAFSLAVAAGLAIAGPVLSYAERAELADLAAKVTLTLSDFARGRFGRRVDLLQQVHDAALSALPHLAPYGITAEALTALQTQIDDLAPLISATRTTIMSRGMATRKLDAKVRKMKRLIKKQLDPLIAPLRTSNPDAFALYEAARLTIDHAGSPGDPAPAAPAAPTAPAATPATATA